MEQKFKTLCLITFLLVSVLVGGNDTFNSLSTFYEKSTYTHEYNCSVYFDRPVSFDCACVAGLWILYKTCSEHITVAGGDIPRCTRLPEAPITKAIRIVQDVYELAVITTSGKVTILRPDTAHIEVEEDWTLVTGSDWTLVDSNGARICLSVIELDSYCYFSNVDGGKLEINAVEKGCNQFDYFLDPQKCEPIKGEYENICEYRPSMHKLIKREAEDAEAEASASVDSDSPNNSSEILEEDEDYKIFQAKSNSTGNNTDLTAIIADAMLDFMNTMLDELLGFHENLSQDTKLPTSESENTMSSGRRKKAVVADDHEEEFANSSNPNPLNVTYTNPVYEFLEISKRITQKTCPSFYVQPQFLNIAVATFIKLQQTHFKFPENSFKPAGFRRILQSLRKCEQFASRFNFTDADCDGRVDGNYTAFGQTIELAVTADYVNFNRYPIIETVWKVFFNAHSYCYPFFNKTLDHHRFTAWMIPLFQNQINDIWVAGKTTERSLNGLFGNQIQVQQNMAYCAVSSRLESAYPFDLPRPARIPEYGPSLLGENEENSGRVKREVDFIEFLTPIRIGNCLDESKFVICPNHIKSITVN